MQSNKSIVKGSRIIPEKVQEKTEKLQNSDVEVGLVSKRQRNEENQESSFEGDDYIKIISSDGKDILVSLGAGDPDLLAKAMNIFGVCLKIKLISLSSVEELKKQQSNLSVFISVLRPALLQCQKRLAQQDPNAITPPKDQEIVDCFYKVSIMLSEVNSRLAKLKNK